MGYHTHEQLQSLGESVKRKAVDVTAGKEYDTLNAMYGPDPRNPQQQQAAADQIPTREEVRAAANKAYADLPDLFTWFATPDPARTSPAIENLWVVVRGVGSALDKEGGSSAPTYPIKDDSWEPNVELGERSKKVDGLIGKNWDGEAYRAFRYNFVMHIDTTIERQGKVASALAVSLQAHKAIRDCFHTDIWKIGQNVTKALDTVGDCNSDDVDSAITVFTAIAGVALAVPTDGVSLVALAGLAKEGASASKDVKAALKTNSGNTKKVPIGGPTVDAIVKNLRSAVNTLRSGTTDQEYELYQFIHAVGQEADRHWDKYVVPKPGRLTALDHANVDKLDGDRQFYDS